ncbi:DnaB-like helicase N-terminal domain-containing protein, partial [Corynebacterium striatum]
MSHETPHIADRADNDPREDPEALLIAALLWNRDTTQAVNLTQTLTPADFYSTDYAAIFATISQQLKSGRPYDPASVRTA